ncbi:MAG: class I SAM-dependent methyltransferase [Chloroflexi bacterium]|nr:class I SAM-dependent methyltransferase [Chloroflexota bacterium]
MYDAFSSDYDRFVDWPGRLKLELPFLLSQLNESGAHRVLDAACGTGRHAIALAQRGFEVAGADLSASMVARASANARESNVRAEFRQAGFGDLAAAFGRASFDAIVCLGNSLPHVLDPAHLTRTLDDFGACLRPGGMLIVQNRNFDAVLASRLRWMEPQAHREGEREWLFMRFYDFDPDGLLTFNIITLQREAHAAWEQATVSTRLRPQPQAELAQAFAESGFASLTFFGDMSGSAFDRAVSGNLVIVCRTTKGSG